MGSKLAIDDWVKELVAMPAREFTLERVQGFLRQHAVEPATLEPYLFFSKGNYTRNLIFKNDLFETMTICWDIGQASRIHNHRDQNCWMAVPIGRLRVQNFRVETRDAAHSTCRLVATDAFDMDPDHPAAVNPVEPVHQVLNLAEFNRRAVSIHVYSRPFASCEVYLPDKGTYFDAPLHYTSEYGRLCAEEKLL
jgi:cysteine dioxygenase